MKVESTNLEGVFVIHHDVFGDSRGFFMESFNKSSFEKLGINADFVQDNLSMSSKGVVRGLHFQIPPFDQGKLVRVITGSVLDVVVDIRQNSKTYGKHYEVELNEANKLSLWVPSGFAHGFATLTDNTIFSYKCTNFYSKIHEQTILWNDKQLAINWRFEHPTLSDKDKNGTPFNLFSSPFKS